MNNKQQNGAVGRKHNLRHVARQIKIPACTQAAELVNRYGAGHMMIKTNCNFIEHRYSMAAQGLTGILPGKPFYIYNATPGGKLI